MLTTVVCDIAQLCFQAGVTQFVISPGSRSAPLTLAMARHTGIETLVAPDERSAAFIALGIALAKKQPVGLVCTSGSAGLNYAPAVAEAYFQQVPLLLLTADRPPEWIGQQDGQTIYQQELFGKHARYFAQLPDSYEHPDKIWQLHRQVNEALSVVNQQPQGPVHLNVPFREPFYPDKNAEWKYRELPLFESWKGERVLGNGYWKQLEDEWGRYQRKLIVVGQQRLNPELAANISKLARLEKIPVLADLLSNLHGLDGVIRHHDSFLFNKDLWNELQPDLLITIGDSVISKSTKQFLRAKPSTMHWHIQEEGLVADAFQQLKRVIGISPDSFFKQIVNRNIRAASEAQAQYRKLWFNQKERAREVLAGWMEQDKYWSEISAVYHLVKNLPDKATILGANSTAIRYLSWVGLPAKLKKVELLANRGTSGIDGCSSTALGYALAVDEPVYLLTGDVAFFYDRNAFWGHKLPTNLKIVLINNHAGGIFRLISGPAAQPELGAFFETEQPLTAELLCQEFGINYLPANNKEEYTHQLKKISEAETISLVEVFFDSAENASIFAQFKQLW